MMPIIFLQRKISAPESRKRHCFSGKSHAPRESRDHGSKIDSAIGVDMKVHPIQLKALALNGEGQIVKVEVSERDDVIFFLHTGLWGYITPPHQREK
ncbi:hypothetical protein [Neptunomonas sp.]|uniref:hypothetical protein n=1 Tax=Neptunomonas sp. TaxID=1971898 RepID=UPI0035616F51